MQLLEQNKNVEGDFIIIQTLLKCNQNCRFCSSSKKEKEMEENEIKKLILSFKKKVKTIVFSGGEPTLKKEIFNLIRFTKKNGLRARLISNGQRLADKEYCKKLISCGLDHITVSVQCHVSKIHDKLTDTLGSRDKCDQAIKNLISLNFFPSIMVTINKMNFLYLLDFAKFLHKEYPRINSVILILLDPVGRAKHNHNVLVSVRKVHKILMDTLAFLESKNYTIDIEGIPFCYLDKFVKYSTEYNQVLNGNSYYVYELGTETIVGGTFKDKLKKLYSHVDACNFCSSKRICFGINKNYLNDFGDKEIFPMFTSEIK